MTRTRKKSVSVSVRELRELQKRSIDIPQVCIVGNVDKLVAELLCKERKVVDVPAAALHKLKLARGVVLLVDVACLPVIKIGLNEEELGMDARMVVVCSMTL